MKPHQKTAQRILRVFAAAVWVALILFAALHRKDFTLDAVLRCTSRVPALAFGVLMLLFALKSLSVVFYAGFLYAAAGVLFPMPVSILAGLCGTLIMAAIPYSFARGIGAAHADELRERHPKLKELERIRNRSPFAFVVALRCINVVNFDIGSMYCGAVRLSPVPFLSGSLLGKLADLVMWSIVGKTAEKRDPLPILIAFAIDLAIMLAVVLWTKSQRKKEIQKL